MSFNPFKKKNPAGESADPQDRGSPDPHSGVAFGTADVDVRGPGDDRTDPLGDMHVEPGASVLRDGPGGRVEIVQVGDDRFLRLTVADSARAELLRPLLLELPEQATGFRDLLVAEDAPLAAAFDLPEAELGSLSRGEHLARPGVEQVSTPTQNWVGQVPTPTYRSIDIVAALHSIASLLAQTAQRGLAWPDPSAELIGFTSEQLHRAEGFRRWRATFTGWDQLAASDEAQAAQSLVRLFIAPLDALLTMAHETKFAPAHLPLAQLLGELEQLAQRAQSYADVAAFQFTAGMPKAIAATDTGRRREHNEDAYALLSLEQSSAAGARFTLAAVADGMGGHNSGEIASSLALDLLRTHLSQLALAPRTSWSVGQTLVSANSPQTRVSAPPLGQYLEQIVPAIGRALNERAALDSGLGGMGTTLAGYALLAPQTSLKEASAPAAQGAVFWVGDSRAYLLSPSGLAPLSVDHSYVQSLVDQGQVTRAEAFTHPQKNIITRCLGGSGQDDRPEVAPFMLGPGELLLLCSDGLTDALREEDVWRVVCGVDSGEPAEIARALVDAANAAGGPDNITVALAWL